MGGGGGGVASWAALAWFALLCAPPGEGLHATGDFRADELFQFVAKFGFQKTETHSRRDSFGYMFGNATSRSEPPAGRSVTLAVLSRELFLRLYSARPSKPPGSKAEADRACRRMFAAVGPNAYDRNCSRNGSDFLRRAPCPVGKLCPDEDAPDNVLPGHQFTYVVQNLGEPR